MPPTGRGVSGFSTGDRLMGRIIGAFAEYALMDACDAIMDKVGKPRGLVRYSSRDGLEGKPVRLLRTRVVLYPAALVVVLGLFLFFLGRRQDTLVTVLRGTGEPYALQGDDEVINQLRVKVSNRGGDDRRYSIALVDAADARLVAPENPLPVAAGRDRTTGIFIILERDAFHDGMRHVVFRVSDGAGFTGDFPYSLLGPRDGDSHDRGEHR